MPENKPNSFLDAYCTWEVRSKSNATSAAIIFNKSSVNMEALLPMLLFSPCAGLWRLKLGVPFPLRPGTRSHLVSLQVLT